MVEQPRFRDEPRRQRDRPEGGVQPDATGESERSVETSRHSGGSPAPAPPQRELRQRAEDRRARERFESEGGNQKQGGPPHQHRDS